MVDVPGPNYTWQFPSTLERPWHDAHFCLPDKQRTAQDPTHLTRSPPPAIPILPFNNFSTLTLSPAHIYDLWSGFCFNF
jgi:hypothetical protein